MILKPEIKRLFKHNWDVYGVRKVWRQMQLEDFNVARCIVARLAREFGLKGVLAVKANARLSAIKQTFAHGTGSTANSKPHHGCIHPTIFGSPFIKASAAHAVLTAEFWNWCTSLGLF